MAALGQERHRGRVLAGELDEFRPDGQPRLGRPRQIGGRVLDADDAGELRERAMVSTDMSITERGGML